MERHGSLVSFGLSVRCYRWRDDGGREDIVRSLLCGDQMGGNHKWTQKGRKGGVCMTTKLTESKGQDGKGGRRLEEHEAGTCQSRRQINRRMEVTK